jgi:hypothetical protein
MIAFVGWSALAQTGDGLFLILSGFVTRPTLSQDWSFAAQNPT